MRIQRTWTWALGTLVVGALAIGASTSEAGKPASHPLVVEGVSPYVETELFTSDDVLAVAQDTWGSDLDTAYMYRDLKVDADGAIWSIFTAYDSTNTVYVPVSDLLVSAHNGIARWDGTDVEIVHATEWRNTVEENETFDADYWEGESYNALELVPTLASSATGDLRTGDLVALRWTDSDPNGVEGNKDDVAELIHFRPSYDANGDLLSLDEQGILMAFPQAGDLGGDLAVDPLGRIYVRLSHDEQNENGGYDLRLWLVAYDGDTGTYAATDALPTTFQMQAAIEVDNEGALYAIGRDWSDDSGVIFRKPIDGAWASYATYHQRCCVRGFHGWAHDEGTFVMALRRDLQKSNYFVGEVVEGEQVAYADRMADTSVRSVDALAADAGGSVYVLHTDRLLVNNVYEIDGQTVYQLDLDTSGGGDGGSPGGGGGKGKNK